MPEQHITSIAMATGTLGSNNLKKRQLKLINQKLINKQIKNYFDMYRQVWLTVIAQSVSLQRNTGEYKISHHESA